MSSGRCLCWGVVGMGWGGGGGGGVSVSPGVSLDMSVIG